MASCLRRSGWWTPASRGSSWTTGWRQGGSRPSRRSTTTRAASAASIEPSENARRIDPWITREEVADFLRAQSIKQDLDKKRRLGTFLATAVREQIDIDVADFSNYGGVRYGLAAIDDFSKKLCVVPLESRRGTDMAQALDVIIQMLGCRCASCPTRAASSTTTPC